MLVEVIGDYSPQHNTVKKVLEEMCKYDECTLWDLSEISSDEPLPPIVVNGKVYSSTSRRFKVILECTYYTPDRWKMLGLKTKRLR